jgi:L-ascorbate metabolism protein UlaG (beta-lactamase superfamily)
MTTETVRLTLIDGPTLLIEFGGLRFLTDPTFDEPRTYTPEKKTVVKLNAPLITPESLLPLDAILLSHDEHFDNLDFAGRAFLPHARRVISTVGAARRLGGNTMGMEPWSSMNLALPDSRTLTITATPARHGPVGIEPVNGHVIGFVLSIGDSRAVYLTGDTVWYAGTEEVSRRFNVGLAILFAGSAQPKGPFNVTMSSNDAIEAATAFPNAKLVAIHNVGWGHYTQSQEDLEAAFQALGIGARIERLTPLSPVTFQI